MFKYLILVSFFNCMYSGPIPASLDWRTKGVVLPVPNQGGCLQVSIINALDALSSAHAINSKKLVQLSIQQIYDCGGDLLCPCTGSFGVSQIYDIIRSNKALNYSVDSAASYPYTGQCTKQCHFQKSGAVVQFGGYLNASNEAALEYLLQEGPVTVAVEANRGFEYYEGGILNDPYCKGTAINHILLVVGYGTENKVDYWIARNSWGTTWGEKGYVRIVRGKNMCGIGNQMVQPYAL